jgi:hypothetical protein
MHREMESLSRVGVRTLGLVPVGSYGTQQYSISHGIMVLGATDRFSCIVSLSKFYSSGDPLFLGHSPRPVFTANREDPCSPRSQ